MPGFNYQFEDRKQYYQNLAEDIAMTESGDMVTVATMPLDTREPLVAAVMEELGKAALRDVDVAVAVDAMTFLDHEGFRPGPLWFPGKIDAGKLRQPYRSYFAALENISDSGGVYRITNQPARPLTLPYTGRSHIKGAIVRSRHLPKPGVRVRFGGHNLNTADESDIMAVSDNETLATSMESLIRHYIDVGNVRESLDGKDQHTRITDEVDLFVDAGVPGQSIILDQALQFIDESQDWIFLTCQYFPGGCVGQHLKTAQLERDVKVQIIFSPPSAHDPILQLGHRINNFYESLRLPKNFFEFELEDGSPLLHAKLLANPSGAMLGTHNYVDPGVKLGTAEAAIRVYDPAFSKAAIEAITRQLPFEHVSQASPGRAG